MIAKLRVILIVLILLFVFAALASPAAAEPECSWGALTSESVADGFGQGSHSADPSGDGHGPGTADEPRVGLANLVEQGNLEATCELVESLLP